MKKILIAFCLLIFITQAAVARPLSEAEVKEVKGDVMQMMTLFNKGDVRAILERTYEPIYALVGGNKKAYEEPLTQAAKQMLQSGIKFLDFQVGEPSEVYAADKREVCFVPTVATMEYQGKKMKHTGFMLAVKTTGQSGWKYLAGDGISKHPEILKTLFPDLDANAKPPPIKMELL